MNFSELKNQPIWHLDGGLASELDRMGYDLDHPLWSSRVVMEHPEALEQVHRVYIERGADIITLATYQMASDWGPWSLGQVIERSVDIARQFDATICGSVGPLGAALDGAQEYTGRYNKSKCEYQEFHRLRIDLLRSHAVDVIACETFPRLDEALAVAELLEEAQVPAWISFYIEDSGRPPCGSEWGEITQTLEAYSSLIAIGVNCCRPDLVSPFLEEVRPLWDRRIVVYPSTGETYDSKIKSWSGVCESLRWQEWVRLGADVIGGCCRVGPEQLNRWK